MKEKQRRGGANFTEAREAGGRSPERDGRREIRAGRQPKGSLPKVGTVRRAVPNLRREAPFPQQGRLRRESGTPAARHPYPFISKGAAAPSGHMAILIVSKTAPTERRPPGASSNPSFDSLAPARSPFGPTYGYSISCLPRRSIVHSVCSVVKNFSCNL